MKAPRRLTIEYDDGSTTGVDFDKVGKPFQSELAKLGLCPPPSGAESPRHFLLLRWKDGWQEVTGVDKDAVGLLRYYIIRRIEDIGRLSLEVSDDYPELFVVERKPREVTSLMILGANEVKYYSLESEAERWEGIFEAGGKKEYLKYDKSASTNPNELSQAQERLSEILDSLRNELDKSGLGAQELLAMDQTDRLGKYKEIARVMGIRGTESQDHVHALVELLLTRLSSS